MCCVAAASQASPGDANTTQTTCNRIMDLRELQTVFCQLVSYALRTLYLFPLYYTYYLVDDSPPATLMKSSPVALYTSMYLLAM